MLPQSLRHSPDTHSDGDALDTLGPKVFVQAGIDADILRSHLLLGEITDRLFREERSNYGTEQLWRH